MPYYTGETVVVYDTDGDVWGLPASAKYFLGYDDGNPVIQEILRRFGKSAHIVTITTVPQANNLAAQVCDCEPNCFSPAEAAYWAKEKIARKERPCIYVNASEKPAVEQALDVYGLTFGVDLDCWMAWWGQPPEIPEGIVKVWNGEVGTGEGNIALQFQSFTDAYDESVCSAAWLGIVPPVPVVKIDQGDVMFIRNPTTGECVAVPGIFVRDPSTQECGIMAGGVTVDLAGFWPEIEKAYGEKFVVTQFKGIFSIFPAGTVTAVNLGETWPSVQSAFGGIKSVVLIEDANLFNLFAIK
jgi:hypothetical protein